MCRWQDVKGLVWWILFCQWSMRWVFSWAWAERKEWDRFEEKENMTVELGQWVYWRNTAGWMGSLTCPLEVYDDENKRETHQLVKARIYSQISTTLRPCFIYYNTQLGQSVSVILKTQLWILCHGIIRIIFPWILIKDSDNYLVVSNTPSKISILYE